MKEESDIMLVDEVAKYLRIPIPTVYKLLQDGRLPGFKVGKHWRIRRRDIENLPLANGHKAAKSAAN
jgi:excisionase family DNA binding protein